MRVTLSALCLLATIAAAASSMAADAGGNYAIWGPGGRSCNQYQRSVEDVAARASFRHFLMGYLTAYNALAPKTYNALGDMSLGQALAWLDDYCAAHQLDSFDRALAQMLIDRHPSRTQAGDTPAASWGRPQRPSGSPPHSVR
ncbi:MAG: hypothetical protein WD928_17335 [Gammaproteobacteria bacterium]